MKYINRSNAKENYTVIPNAISNDENLSWGARGLLLYLLTKSEDWICRKADLIKQTKAGERVVERILKELADNKYLFRIRIRGIDNKFSWETHVFDSPQINLSFENNKWKEFYKSKAEK